MKWCRVDSMKLRTGTSENGTELSCSMTRGELPV
jgi:hypothetical protein